MQVLHKEDLVFSYNANQPQLDSRHGSVSFKSTNLFRITRKIINKFVKNSKYEEVTGNMYLLMRDKKEKTLKFRIR